MSRTFQEYSPEEKVNVLSAAHRSAQTALEWKDHECRRLERNLDIALSLLRDARFGKPFKRRADQFVARMAYA